MFPGGAAEGNKINCFPTGPVIKCLYSTKRKACNGDRRSTFAGNSALLPSDVKDCDSVSLAIWEYKFQASKLPRARAAGGGGGGGETQLYNNIG